MKRRVLLSLLLTLLCLSSFSLIAITVAAEGALTRYDAEQSNRLYHFTFNSPPVWDFFVFVTDLGAGPPILLFAYGLLIAMLLHRQYRLTLLCAAVMLLNAHSIDWLKEYFGRVRPPTAPPMNPSFPSGHTQGSMVIYGLAIYLAFLRWPESRFRWVVAGGLGTLIVLIGLSRMMLGVHYFSDVLAGMFMGMTWIGLVITAVEWQRSRTRS
jgi:membrane-associated phospholipid phosphatase